MKVFSTFEHSNYLELAILRLEKKGIDKHSILAIPLDNRTEERNLFDTLHRSDGVSLIDLAMALATAFAVIGASVGFGLDWGPIYWGLIGAVLGFGLGFVIKVGYFKIHKKKQRLIKGKHSEIILIIHCNEPQIEFVEAILWEHFALGVAKLKI